MVLIRYILGSVIFFNLSLSKSHQGNSKQKYEICLTTDFSTEHTLSVFKNGELSYEGRASTDKTIEWAGSFYFELDDTVEISYNHKKVMVTFEKGYYYNEVRYNDSLFLNDRRVSGYGNN